MGYLANHLNLMEVTYKEFHRVLRKYMPRVSMYSLKKIATHGMVMSGGYNDGLPCEVAMKIGCAVYDLDQEMDGFDYRRLFSPIEGFDQVAGANTITNAFYRAITTIIGDWKVFIKDFNTMVEDAKERKSLGMEPDDRDGIVLYLDAKMDKVFRGETWQDEIYVPYKEKRSIEVLRKMLNYRVRYYTIAPVALKMSELMDVMGGYKLDPRFLLDEMTPNDAFRQRDVFLKIVKLIHS